MKDTKFELWFADLFGESESEGERLLRDKTAIQFLIAWSLFESRCFSGFLKAETIQSYAERLTKVENFDVSSISDHAHYFHARYQEKRLHNNLMHKDKSAEFEAIRQSPVLTLTPTQAVFFSTFVVYRFRNNIFHGNKGVRSWLKFTEQIGRCTHVMQLLISHAEAIECRFNPVKVS